MKNGFMCFGVLCLLGLAASTALAKEYHVSVNGCDENKGSKAKPFRTIQAAANVAQPGDVITVHEGVYRERINPPRGGSDKQRIVYRAAKGAKVVLKGSEVVKGWEKVEGDTWKVVLPNTFFGEFNPFNDLIHGDWFNRKDRDHHTGAVYLEGHWLTEAAKLDEVQKPIDKTPLWFAQVDDKNTTVWAQFKGVNPNEAEVEVNVRRTVFYPDKPGRNFITVRGFTMMHAATPWAPPTAEQIGLIGTHWSKGWIIEDNDISYSVCTGVTLGKYGDEFDNTSQNSAEGYVKTIERALQNGWSKENIGHHIVRNNHISNCEQAGIVGSMGAVFSQITGNRIHDIHVRQLFGGAEMGGIKIHASNDMLIANNHVYRCFIGIWLDWMAQGVRVTSNLVHDCSFLGLFPEVNHGPFVVDNNIILSETAIQDWSQGGCYAHNLIGGKISIKPQDRQTPYQMPHSVEVAGYSDTPCGDNRFYNNIFVSGSGLAEYAKETFRPSFVEGNVYLNMTKPYPNEKNSVAMPEFDPKAKLVEKDGATYLHLALPDMPEGPMRPLVTTELLGKTAKSQLPFENYDAEPLKINRDYFGKKRNTKNPAAGPFEKAGQGELVLKAR
jgi:alpha-L-arabinofuranosidase